MEKDEIIAYHASHSDLEITFLVPREDDQTINRFARNIKDQNELKQTQVAAILNYINNDKECRSKQLLNYFGEQDIKPCGVCDICLGETNQDSELDDVKKQVVKLLNSQEASSRTLLHLLQCGSDTLLKVLQELLEDGKIALNSKNEYKII